jgi:hypothetical protein
LAKAGKTENGEGKNEERMKRLKPKVEKKAKLTAAIIVILFSAWVLIGIGIWVDVKITNWRRLSEIKEMNANSYQTFSKFIADIEDNTEWSVLIISGLRTKERQKELIRENGKNASAGKSRHVLGRAIDINLYRKNWLWRVWLKKFNSKKDWRNTGVVRISEKYGLLWGGSYRSYHDPVHFEIN